MTHLHINITSRWDVGEYINREIQDVFNDYQEIEPAWDHAYGYSGDVAALRAIVRGQPVQGLEARGPA
jgi:hemoglobin-like flavoprotein